jgi:hypothetical protein
VLLVLNDIPVLDETSIMQANDLHNSLRADDFRQAGSRVPATHDLHGRPTAQARHSKNAVVANSTISLFWIGWSSVLIENAAFWRFCPARRAGAVE